MGGWRGRSLLLGLLLLLSGALPPGAAQEETIAPPADSSVVPTVLLPVGPSDFPDLSVSSGVSGSADATSEAPGNEATTERPPPPPTESAPESNGHVTTAPGDITGTNNEPLSDPNKTSVTDSHDIATTQPPPTTAPTSRAGSVTPDSTTPTPSPLITLRTMAPTNTQLNDDSTPHTTASTSIPSTLMSTITSSLIINNTVTRVSTTAPHTTRAEGQQGPSVLEVGHKKDLPSSSSNTLFVMVISIFTIMTVTVVVVVGFHRYKNRNSRNAFRRLQDLPMDDMMEDTPLYSY